MSNHNAFCLINYKGGTGKTCTLVNLAAVLAEEGKRVLIIDTDPQGSVGYHFGVQPTQTLYDIIVQNTSVTDCIVSVRHHIDLIGSNDHLFPAINHLHQLPQRELILKNRLTPVFDQYDVVLLDCSPSMNLMNQNALICAPRLLIPVSMDYMTLLGIKQLVNNGKLLHRHFNAPIQIAKIIPTFYNVKFKKTKHIMDSLEQTFPNQISTPIRVNLSISEAAGMGKTILEYAPKGPAADDFKKLTKEVLTLL